MSVQKQFDKAVEIVKNLPPTGDLKPTQDQQLEFYANFKQANEGDCTGTRPGAFDFKGKYKYDAWKKIEGTSKEDAQKKYIELLRGDGSEESKKLLAELDAAGQ